jgi:hypothetical protein
MHEKAIIRFYNECDYVFCRLCPATSKGRDVRQGSEHKTAIPDVHDCLLILFAHKVTS